MIFAGETYRRKSKGLSLNKKLMASRNIVKILTVSIKIQIFDRKDEFKIVVGTLFREFKVYAWIWYVPLHFSCLTLEFRIMCLKGSVISFILDIVDDLT